MAFYLQSIFIRFVGDNPNIDKLYFFILTLISLGLLLLFWRQRFPQVRLPFVWLPILFGLYFLSKLMQSKHEKTWPEGYLPVNAEFQTFQLFKKTRGYV